MGFNDDMPQKLPGMEGDAITDDETDLTDVMQTLTRAVREKGVTVNKEILSVVRAMGGDHLRDQRERARAIRAHGRYVLDKAASQTHFRICKVITPIC